MSREDASTGQSSPGVAEVVLVTASMRTMPSIEPCE